MLRPSSAVGLTLLALSAWSGESLRVTPVVRAVELVSPAVVHIATDRLSQAATDTTVAPGLAADEFFRRYADPDLGGREVPLSLGSGTIIDPRGYVLTNQHVVEKASRLVVILSDGRSFDASVVGRDLSSDLAVLRINADGALPVAQLGTSSDLRIGETLIAIGNPFALSHSVTVGVLSATGRSVRTGRRVFADFLQTDAAINPGNSGGPIVNLDGAVVGIATAIHSEGHGIGFALPIDRAKRIIYSLMRDGTVQPAWIGLEAKPASGAIAKAAGVGNGNALVVTHVASSGPAAAAGLRTGDVVLEVAGESIRSLEQFESRLWSLPQGGALSIGFARDGKRVEVDVRPVDPRARDHIERIQRELLGITIEARSLGERGVLIGTVVAGSRAAMRGFQVGDIIYEIDGVVVNAPSQFQEAFFQSLAKGTVLILVQHGDSAYYIPLGLQ